MLFLDWTILTAIGGLGLLVLLLGLRGRRVDALPRCRKRRCRYDLTSFLGETHPGRAYPITCPECGRVAAGERAVRWGRRRARRWVVGIGALLLALTGAVAGVEVYTRTQSVNTITWLPLFMLLDRAPKDTQANAYVHQIELLRRADAGEIDASGAARVVRRILAWQKDESVEWGFVGDVFAALAAQELVPESEVREFWNNILLITARVREEVEEGDPIPVEVAADWRGHGQPPYYHSLSQAYGTLRLRPDDTKVLPDLSIFRFYIIANSTLDAIDEGRTVPVWRPTFGARSVALSSPFSSEQTHITLRRQVPSGSDVAGGAVSLLRAGAAGSERTFVLRGRFDVGDSVRPGRRPPLPVLTDKGLRRVWEHESTHTVRFVPRDHYRRVQGFATMANEVRAVPSVELTIAPDLEGMGPAQAPAAFNNSATPMMGYLWLDEIAPQQGFAAEMFLRIGDEEIPLGRHILRRSLPYLGSAIHVSSLFVDRIRASTDDSYLVLRCDEEAVRRSVDLHSWDGEIVLRLEIVDLLQRRHWTP
ncbi:MAG: hypothetical protein KF684_11600 [Phycisphaeraceae bacterium]|nr:hypothetical protein [Phycisphaeraceae bacterium]